MTFFGAEYLQCLYISHPEAVPSDQMFTWPCSYSAFAGFMYCSDYESCPPPPPPISYAILTPFSSKSPPSPPLVPMPLTPSLSNSSPGPLVPTQLTLSSSKSFLAALVPTACQARSAFLPGDNPNIGTCPEHPPPCLKGLVLRLWLSYTVRNNFSANNWQTMVVSLDALTSYV